MAQQFKGHPQYSLSDDSSILLDIWNQVRNILQHGLYKDTTIEKAIINDTFETITNIHELDLDTLFKIMEAIVEETTPGPIASGGKSQTESLVRIIVNKNRRAQT